MHRQYIGQRLARMAQVGQSIDDRQSVIACQLFRALVRLRTANDGIDELPETLSEVGRGLTFSPSHIVAKKQTGATELCDSSLKAHASTQTWFFK